MQVKLLFLTFILNCGLHAVSVGKPSEWDVKPYYTYTYTWTDVKFMDGWDCL